MEFQNKITKLVTKLIRLTADDKIKWELRDPPKSITSGTDEIVPLFFQTMYKNKAVGIYQGRYQSYLPDTESFYWSETIGFAVLDFMDRVLWESRERSPALNDLMEIVREKASGIDDLLDDLLKEDEI